MLSGLRQCLDGVDCVVFVEVRDDNIAEFRRLIDEIGFRKVEEYRRYGICSNWILTR